MANPIGPFTEYACLGIRLLAVATIWLTVSCNPANADPKDYFAIHVVDDQTGNGVPLVELCTVNGVRRYTDSAGWVAIDEPGLQGQRVYFHVSSHGYEFPTDGFGYRGKALTVERGQTAVLRINRQNIAERLYRVTGEGIYRDSALLDQPTPIQQPLLNGQVFGSDSVQNVVFGDQIYWFWGDTQRPSYPLGNFHVPGAVSQLPERGGLRPDQGVELDYFVDSAGFAKPTCRMPGKGPTWLNGLVVLPDENGKPRMFAKYVKIEPPLSVVENGLVVFDEQAQEFEQVTELPLNAPLMPGGHPFLHEIEGQSYVYFPLPYPTLRVPATVEAYTDVDQYETYTCLMKADDGSLQVERNPRGSAVYRWRLGGIRQTRKLEKRLVNSKQLGADEGLYHLRDIDSGEVIRIHSASVYWNDYRDRWVLIGVQEYGTSHLGEVWFAEAKQPQGPWVKTRKIVTHNQYSFYNPKQHPMFDQEQGRLIFFEGTYTHTFSGNPDRTPRYDYNQIMYRLDLSDPRLTFD